SDDRGYAFAVRVDDTRRTLDPSRLEDFFGFLERRRRRLDRLGARALTALIDRTNVHQLRGVLHDADRDDRRARSAGDLYGLVERKARCAAAVYGSQNTCVHDGSPGHR